MLVNCPKCEGGLYQRMFPFYAELEMFFSKTVSSRFARYNFCCINWLPGKGKERKKKKML